MADKQERPQRPWWVSLLIYGGTVLWLLYIGFSMQQQRANRISYSEFLTAIEDGKLESVRVTNSEFVGALKKTDQASEPASISTPRLPETDESWLMQCQMQTSGPAGVAVHGLMGDVQGSFCHMKFGSDVVPGKRAVCLPIVRHVGGNASVPSLEQFVMVHRQRFPARTVPIKRRTLVALFSANPVT